MRLNHRRTHANSRSINELGGICGKEKRSLCDAHVRLSGVSYAKMQWRRRLLQTWIPYKVNFVWSVVISESNWTRRTTTYLCSKRPISNICLAYSVKFCWFSPSKANQLLSVHTWSRVSSLWLLVSSPNWQFPFKPFHYDNTNNNI